MSNKTQTNKPRIFISHAWEDKPLVLRLEAELIAAGAEVWVDHVGIRGGDNLPKRISDALEWCNTLLLVWSKAASESPWVELEWTNAISLNAAIIPCCLDGTRLPALLAHKVYLDLHDSEAGITQLLHALKLARQPIKLASTETTEKLARVIHSQLAASPIVKKLKPPHTVVPERAVDTGIRESATLRRRRGFLIAFAVLSLIGLIVVISNLSDWSTQKKHSALAENKPNDQITVEVLNACGVQAIGTEIGQYLRDHGFDVVDIGNYQGGFDLDQTFVIDRVSLNSKNAAKVADVLGVNKKQVAPQMDEIFETNGDSSDWKRLQEAQGL